MKRTLLPALALLLGLLASPTQAQPTGPRSATVFDLTSAAGPTLDYASAAAWHLWGLDAAGRYQVGLGGRVSHFFGDGYALNPQAGPANAEIRVARPAITSFNAAFHLRARVAGPLRVGFNLDALGLSAGPGRDRQDLSAAGLPGPAGSPVRPVAGNVLLGGRPDRGSLNSELYAAVRLSGGLSLRVGYSHLVTAYEDDDSRFHRFHNLAALGLSYQLPQSGFRISVW
ncbi:hypothetical protein ACFQ48_02310 [Hymenobacter caeli]|uniref:Outer membrane protein beta-barrel domain-containing protein n=1 Tax=Hymenobacter caeli TaxID=2735894 RepID=A0ABX2FLE5_9BACT|nr:hypothetical protein [Hymenobacter caeli]NRT17658.1 hypothetical protein [Hymenobacter caeli]